MNKLASILIISSFFSFPLFSQDKTEEPKKEVQTEDVVLEEPKEEIKIDDLEEVSDEITALEEKDDDDEIEDEEALG